MILCIGFLVQRLFHCTWILQCVSPLTGLLCADLEDCWSSVSLCGCSRALNLKSVALETIAVVWRAAGYAILEDDWSWRTDLGNGWFVSLCLLLLLRVEDSSRMLQLIYHRGVEYRYGWCSRFTTDVVECRYRWCSSLRTLMEVHFYLFLFCSNSTNRIGLPPPFPDLRN